MEASSWNTESWGSSGCTFPLTLTLSLGEREQQRLTHRIPRRTRYARRLELILPLLGERAGVRASVYPHFSSATTKQIPAASTVRPTPKDFSRTASTNMSFTGISPQ